MDILDIFGHFYLNHLSPLWAYFVSVACIVKLLAERLTETNEQSSQSPEDLYAQSKNTKVN